MIVNYNSRVIFKPFSSNYDYQWRHIISNFQFTIEEYFVRLATDLMLAYFRHPKVLLKSQTIGNLTNVDGLKN